MQKFQLLRRHSHVQLGHARDITPRAVKAGDKAGPDRVGADSNTIGIVVVAAFAANAAAVVVAVITAT